MQSKHYLNASYLQIFFGGFNVVCQTLSATVKTMQKDDGCLAVWLVGLFVCLL